MSGKKWTLQEDQVISELYPNSTINEMMSVLPGRSWRAIYIRAALTGIKKSPEFLRSEKCGRLYTGHKRSKDSQFKAGQKPWNKGLKGICFEGSEKGWFKKGSIPPNTKPEGDGAITIRKNKGFAYKYIRIALGKWRQLHTHTWEQANGHIPEGHIVVFKDGDTMNCAIENLEMISHDENMRRNSRHRYPKEINELIQIKLVFTRKINKIKKKYGKSK